VYFHILLLCDYVMSAKMIAFRSNLLIINCTIVIKAIGCMLYDLSVNLKVLLIGGIVHESVC